MRNAPSSIGTVVFDLDDTLYPERSYVHSGYVVVAEHLRETLSRPEAFDQWLWDRFCDGKTDGAFDALNEEFQLQLTTPQIGELVSVYRNHAPTISPFEGIPELLARLYEQRRLGLLSDGFLPAQRLKLQALKLEQLFDAVVFTEELGRESWKPSPAGFEKICELLDVEHETCTYVADNPAKDFVAPNGLGWRTIQLVQPGQVHSAKPAPQGGCPQVVIQHLDELEGALR